MTTVRTRIGGTANLPLVSGQDYRNCKVTRMEMIFPGEWLAQFPKEILLVQELALPVTEVHVISVDAMLNVRWALPPARWTRGTTVFWDVFVRWPGTLEAEKYHALVETGAQCILISLSYRG